MDKDKMDAAVVGLETIWARHQVYIQREITTRRNLEDAANRWQKALEAKAFWDVSPEEETKAHSEWKSSLKEWTEAKEGLMRSHERLADCIAACGNIWRS